MVSSSRPLRFFDGVGNFSENYDSYILDLWGVIHNGVNVFPGVIDCLENLRKAGKQIILLSNAPRRSEIIAQQLEGFGVGDRLYDAVVSSGQEAYDNLLSRKDPFYQNLGKRCCHIGPPRDEHLIEGLNLEVVSQVEDSDFILNTGPWKDGETVADYEDLLRAGADRKIPMVCSNPDLEVVRGTLRMICAGALARRYEELGAPVRYHGKPHISIYERCFDLLAGDDKTRMIAIGDSLRTDIAGAIGAGLDSVLVTGGLHGEEMGLAPGQMPSRQVVEKFCAASGNFPTAILPTFKW